MKLNYNWLKQGLHLPVYQLRLLNQSFYALAWIMVRMEYKTVTLKAIDVRPYKYSIWCTIADSESFVNEIVYRKWSEDGEYIWWMLDTHNFAKHKPDEMVEVIELEDKYLPSDFEEEPQNFLSKRPKPTVVCQHCGQKIL